LNDETTLDENHPTLKARALGASIENTLPYPYAVARRDATLYEIDPKHQDGVREKQILEKGSVFAVVGSWNTLDEFDQRKRLALLTSGQFVQVRDLDPLRLPKSFGVLLDGIHHKLPIAFAHRTASDSTNAIEVIELTGTSRLVDGERQWTKTEGGTLREKEATIIRLRQEFPSFVTKTTHFADIDFSVGSVILYEGKLPTYATIALSLPEKQPNTGISYVRSKQVTLPQEKIDDSLKATTLRDLAWVIEVDNGLLIHAATHPRKFHHTSSLELHPEDAKRLFQWLAPEVPENWHSITTTEPKQEGAAILLH
jgi:hypothetical protein